MDSNLQYNMPLDPDLVFGKKKKSVRLRNVFFIILFASTIGVAMGLVVYYAVGYQHSNSDDPPIPAHMAPVCKDQCV